MNVHGVTIRDFTYWKIVISLGLASFFTFGTIYSFQPILPLITNSFNISISYASLSMSLSIIGLVIGLLIAGFLSDRYGRLAFIYVSLFFTSIILFLIPFVNSFSLIISFRFIQGFAFAGIIGVALAYMAEEIHPKHLGFAATLYVSCNSVGGMMGRFLIGYLAEAYSWESALILYGLFGVFTFIVVLFLLPKSAHFIKSNKAIKYDFQGFFVHLRNPFLLVLFGLGLILQMSFTGMWTFLPFHLLEPPYNYSLQAISYFYLAYIFGVVGAPIAGSLSNRFKMQHIRVVGVIILAIGLALTLANSIFIIGIGLSLACLGLFVSHSITTATVSLTATHHRGSASSLYLVAYYIGVSAGTTMLTPLWEHFNWLGIILFTALVPIFYVLTILFVQKKTTSN